MSTPLVLTSLADKRSRLEAERDYHQKRADKAATDITKIDAVMALWDEKPQLVAVRRRYREHGEEFRWKEIARTVVSVLREAPAGLTTTEVQHVIAESKGITDRDELRRLARRVTAALSDKRREGLLVQDGKRDNCFIFRIAQEGEGVKCKNRIAEYEARNRKRTAERIARRKKMAYRRAGAFDDEFMTDGNTVRGGSR